MVSARGLEKRVDERRDDGSLSEHQKAAEEHQEHDERREPKLLPLFEETPQIGEELHQYGLSMRLWSSSPARMTRQSAAGLDRRARRRAKASGHMMRKY